MGNNFQQARAGVLLRQGIELYRRAVPWPKPQGSNAFHKSADTYPIVKGLVAIPSIHDSARISIPQLTVQWREEYPREISFERLAMPTSPLKKAYRFIWV